MWFRVDESHGWAGNELTGGTIANVIDEGLTVRGDEDGYRAVDTVGHDAVVKWQGDGGRLTAEQHLAEEFRSIIRTRKCSCRKGELGSWADNPSVGNGKGRIGWNAEITGTVNERSSKRKNFRWGKSDIKGGRHSRSSARQDVENRLMTSLDRQDGASGGKKDGVGKEWGRTKVSANANGLYYSRCSSHGSDISES